MLNSIAISNKFERTITFFTRSASSSYLRELYKLRHSYWGHTVRIDYAIIGLSILLLVVAIYLAGLSLQITDAPARVETVTYATYLFVASIAILIFMAIISLIKKAITKPE